MESKITREHLKRKALIYVRQSTADQVLNNKESQLLQYGLVERAKILGWPDEQIQIIDEDLGCSAGGTIRNGFNYILEDVCAKQVGGIFSTNASRLARNGREWHTLLEYCGIVNTLLVDQETVYNLQLSNDRLLLGFKGEFNEMELRAMQERSQAAIKAKAKRGELYLMIGAGYIKGPNHTLTKDPDKRVRKTISLVFEKFQQLGSIRQTYNWFMENKVEIPVVAYKDGNRTLEWKIASANTFGHILDNPIYSGAYVYGRTKSIIEIKDGRKHIRKGVKQKKENWDVFIKDHHEGYLSWQEYEINQEKIAHNTNKKRPIVMGSSTGQGHALLSGLLRCVHCGSRLSTRYQGNSGRIVNYHCPGKETPQGKQSCINFGGTRVDQAISNSLLDLFSTHGSKVAELAIESLSNNQSQVIRQKSLALEQSRYEQLRAKRQYDAVDPENRLVAASLESAWNDSLKSVLTLESEISAIKAQTRALSKKDHEEILALAHDLPFVWSHPESSPSIKRNILRTVIKEIMVGIDCQVIYLKIHWQGGDHTQVEVRKHKKGQTIKTTDKEVEKIITSMARMMTDKDIANFLNRRGKHTASGLTWTPPRVCSFRNDRHIPVYKEGEREQRGELTVNETSEALNVSASKVRKLIKKGIIPAEQVCYGALWVIKREALQLEVVQRETLSTTKSSPLTPNSKQESLGFQ